MKRCDKLVRDGIPGIIAADGRQCKTRILAESELQEHLLAKLHEEVAEFEKQPCVEEIADIIVVLNALAKQLGSNMEEVEQVRIGKSKKRGGFDKRLFLEYVE
jgi:predicted house-cleaning noncanonical NTP pyrophosphatase (MazG superfamily)